jgi:hypothetical protein
MSEKMKKHSEDLSFSFSRWFRRVSANTPTTFIATVAIIGYAIFLFSGGLYTLVVQPIMVYPYGSTVLFLYPNLSMQFGGDTIVTAILFSLGFFGMYSIYQSAKSVSKPKQAYMLLIAGISLLTIVYCFLEVAINIKISGT